MEGRPLVLTIFHAVINGVIFIDLKKAFDTIDHEIMRSSPRINNWSSTLFDLHK